MQDIDTAIAQKQRVVEKLRAAAAELPQHEADLATLLRAKQLLNGTGTIVPAIGVASPRSAAGQKPTIGDLADLILGDVTELHVNEILKRLSARGVQTTKATLVNTLLRDAKDGKRFRRTKPNTFARLAS